VPVKKGKTPPVKKAGKGSRAVRYLLSADRKLQKLSLKRLSADAPKSVKPARPAGRAKPAPVARNSMHLPRAGDRAEGEFGHTLNLTDIHTTWVESRALLGKSQVAVQETLERLREALPFALQGIDSDNGSEFINDHLYRYCRRRQIQFTRAADGSSACAARAPDPSGAH
jgi:hypothetical protein